MKTKQDEYQGQLSLFSGLNITVFIFWVFISSVVSRNTDALTFTQLTVIFLPIAIAIAWFARTRINHTVIKLTDESITIERSGNKQASLKWEDIQNAELSNNNQRGLDLFTQSGALKLHIPHYIERFSDLSSVVLERINAEHEQTSRKQYFQSPKALQDAILWAIPVALVYTYFAYLHFQDTGSFETTFPGSIGIIIVASVFAIQSMYNGWHKPKQVRFLQDHLEVTTTLRNIKIPYSEIANAKLVPNPWAPANSTRKLLRIGRKDKAGGYTVRGLESNSPELLATLQEYLNAGE